MAKKNLAKELAALLAGNSIKECWAIRQVVAFAATGLGSRRWWKSGDEFLAAADKRPALRRAIKQIDPATIAMIVEMIMAMLENKD